MEEVNKIDLWDCVDNSLLDMQIYLDVLDLFNSNLEYLVIEKDLFSANALEQLKQLCSLSNVIKDGLKGVKNNLEKGLEDSDD